MRNIVGSGREGPGRNTHTVQVAKRIGLEFSSQPRCLQESRVHNSGLKQEPRTWGPISLSFSGEDKACKGKAVAT